VFGNQKIWIADAIIKAHKKWANHPQSVLEKVNLVLFSYTDLFEGLESMLTQNGINYRHVQYVNGKPGLVSQFQPTTNNL